MMKESRYNYSEQDDTGLLLYNSASGEILAMHKEVAEVFMKSRRHFERIQNVHPELYNYLCDHGFFVDDDCDEVERLITRWKDQEQKTRHFKLVVNPTLDCNFSCWYCYEKHDQHKGMSSAVSNAVLAFVNHLVDEGNYKEVELSFFGGEPLLYYDSVVVPLIEGVASACSRAGIGFSLHFTTNAYLLTDERLEWLSAYNTSFQITIDGNEKVHNGIRKTFDGFPTYSVIIANSCKALALGCRVGIRFNYTAQFLPSFIDVLLDFENLSEAQRHLLSFNFQRVWQDSGGNPDKVIVNVKKLEERFRQEGFTVIESEQNKVPFCYADRNNSVVVNYDGLLYSCTARDFTEANSEGMLSPGGYLEWNENHIRRQKLKYGNATCRSCRIYPLCHGGCSQMKLDYGADSGCLKGFSTEQKEKILSRRLHELMVLQQTKD